VPPRLEIRRKAMVPVTKPQREKGGGGCEDGAGEVESRQRRQLLQGKGKVAAVASSGTQQHERM
jgi:hypothetical protein